MVVVGGMPVTLFCQLFQLIFAACFDLSVFGIVVESVMLHLNIECVTFLIEFPVNVSIRYDSWDESGSFN